MDKRQVLEIMRKEQVKFLRLQFTDILGAIKSVEVPETQFESALEGEIIFDGSALEGLARIEESDMLLKPDPNTFRIFPWKEGKGKVARLICDIYNADGTAFEGCPRQTLKRVVAEAAKLGYTMYVAPEIEFFLFMRDSNGGATTVTHDAGGYFDLVPLDKGEEARREIINALVAMGLEVEATHHEIAPGQHEIDLKHAEAITAADNISTFRFVVKRVALDYGFHATFMPKPIYGVDGSGMHLHQSLFKDGKNAFYDPDGRYQLSDVARHYIAGLLRHARGYAAVTNPLVNSYKRLVPGFEAPTHAVWSERNINPLVRVPASRGQKTRCELRMPDPSCNPYLALAVTLKAGLDGIKNKLDPGPPINKNIYRMSHREQRRFKIDSLPTDLNEAVAFLQKDKVIQEALGDHIFKFLVQAKKAVWQEYIAQVHPWELSRYLAYY